MISENDALNKLNQANIRIDDDQISRQTDGIVSDFILCDRQGVRINLKYIENHE